MGIRIPSRELNPMILLEKYVSRLWKLVYRKYIKVGFLKDTVTFSS